MLMFTPVSGGTWNTTLYDDLRKKIVFSVPGGWWPRISAD